MQIDIQKDSIKAEIKNEKSIRKYEFPNLTDTEEEKTDKSIDKALKLNPKNEIHTSPEWINEQVENLIFKDNDKNMHKVIFNLKEKVFALIDDNKTKGTSIVSLLSFDEYKIKFVNECKVKINYFLIKDLIPLLRSFSDKIMIKMDSDYPIKFMCYENMYKIMIIVAPLIENE